MNRHLPELYVYIYRNIVIAANGSNVVSRDSVLKSLNTVIKRAPRYVLSKIIEEMIDNYGILKKLSNDRLIIIKNDYTERRLLRLKDHIWPFNF